MPLAIAVASRLNVSSLAGSSISVASAVKLSSAPSSTIRLPIAASTGASLTSLTVIVIVSASDSTGVPSSVTVTVAVNVPGPCTSVGVQLNTPPESIIMPLAIAVASRLNVITLAGSSVSVASAVKLSSAPSSTLRSPIAPSTGASFTEFTVIDTVATFESSSPSLAWNVNMSGPLKFSVGT